MTQILRGKDVATQLKEEIKERVQSLKDKGVSPKLAVLRVGENPNDLSYERGILKNCENLGLETEIVAVQEDITTEGLLAEMDKLNKDDKVHGILMFRPLPKHIDEKQMQEAIDPSKDVDCMHPYNLARVFASDKDTLEPATPRSAMEILKYYGFDLTGKRVVIINRSMVLGRPLAMMMLSENASPMICHSKTRDLPALTKAADVVVLAAGRAKSFGEEYFTEDSVIIDVGVSEAEDGSIAGDADYEKLQDKVKAITPVPGGVGSMTTTLLLNQVVRACEMKVNK